MNYYTTILSKIVGLKDFWWLPLLTALFWQDSWAAREAVVITNKAIIYSTIEMQAPLGFIPRGKKVLVGEVARNWEQVYPIIVSGKVAYIRAKDLSFESMSDDNFVATRFYNLTKESHNTHYSLGFINYSSQYNSPATGLDGPLTWYGYQLKGESYYKRWGVHLMTSGMWANKGEEQFRSIELGVGGSYMMVELKRFRLNFFAQLVGVPFANYALGSKFRVNGGGYGGGLGLAATYDVKKRWGVEGSLGVYQTRLMGFDTPEEFESPEPTFSGARTVLSAYYRF